MLDIIDKSLFEKRISEMNDYGYNSLVFCVIDSVYSIAARYSSTKAVVERFANYLGKSIKDQYLISDFIKDFGNFEVDDLAENIFKNRQRTSTTNGILKADAVMQFIKVLEAHGIETNEDLLIYKDRYKLMYDVRNIKGQGKGLTFDYVLMLAGDVDTFKPDRHIINFFSIYFGIKDTSNKNIEALFRKQLKIVKNEYPNINVRTLDGVIWLYMSNKK